MSTYVKYALASMLLLSCVRSRLHASQQQKPSQAALTEDAVLRHSRELVAQHHTEAATDLLRTYVAEHATSVSALTMLAQVRHDAGNDADALKLLASALNIDPQAREANLLAGKLLLSGQHYPEAMDRFETLLSKTPHDEAVRGLELEAATKLASSASQAGNPEAGLAALQHARTKMPDNSRLLMEIGLQALDLKLYSASDEALHAARKLTPSDADISYALARLELEEQHMPQAEADLKTYLTARPNDATAHFGLGRILAMELRDDEAKKEFQRSTELQPVQTESYYQLGQLALNSHEDEQASALFQQVIKRDPKHGGALVGLGQIAYQSKRYVEAEGFLSRAVIAAPEYGPAHYYLGLVLARLGRKAEADQELQKATQMGKTAAAPVQSNERTTVPQ